MAKLKNVKKYNLFRVLKFVKIYEFFFKFVKCEFSNYVWILYSFDIY